MPQGINITVSGKSFPHQSSCESMLAGLKSSLLQVALEPYNELPSRLALYHACRNALFTLSLALSYVKEYGAYWVEALKDDVEAVVEKERELAPREAGELYEALEVAMDELERTPSLAFIELLDIGSLAYLPEVVGGKELKKAVLGTSLGLHVEKKHKRALEKALGCLVAMSGAVLGER